MEKDFGKQSGIDRTKVALVVCAVLVVVLATFSSWSYSELQLQKDLRVQAYDSLVVNQYAGLKGVNKEFFFYYVQPEEQKFGVYNLDDELNGLEWAQPYEVGVFDCGEMAAYLERYLENLGWRTVIVVGDTPFGSGRHAWLLVETSEGKFIPVESTKIQIIWWSDPNFDDYLKYEHRFENIYLASSYDEESFDWWRAFN